MPNCMQPMEMKTVCGDIPLIYKWHWDHETKSCERLPYFGCEPTRNNFYSLNDCRNIARPVCIKLPNDDRYKYSYDIE
ncbi:hypothetical protein NQ314_008414 [Rhamnusium bicolor]|uniref:BPTI/Kunitz inhibitor domain-containing protein n=1 Tax=Rhamnusium bicolor TaxID=1586634 RepID=A0AAV8YCV7_9CUCU|nr:hypothetical protein NQ314_008414 [Rhamnusium bicolor]